MSWVTISNGCFTLYHTSIVKLLSVTSYMRSIQSPRAALIIMISIISTDGSFDITIICNSRIIAARPKIMYIFSSSFVLLKMLPLLAKIITSEVVPSLSLCLITIVMYMKLTGWSRKFSLIGHEVGPDMPIFIVCMLQLNLYIIYLIRWGRFSKEYERKHSRKEMFFYLLRQRRSPKKAHLTFWDRCQKSPYS